MVLELREEKRTFVKIEGEKVNFFLLTIFYTIKCTGGPPKSGPGLRPAQKMGPDLPSGMVMGGIFLSKITGFFWPGPQNAQV